MLYSVFGILCIPGKGARTGAPGNTHIAVYIINILGNRKLSFRWTFTVVLLFGEAISHIYNRVHHVR
jgi:hypothetical protein